MDCEPMIQVVGIAASGEELLTNIDSWQPQVITLDLRMPGIGGLATLDRVLKWRKVPVIILSTLSSKGAPQTIEALHRGAVDFIDKQQYSLVNFGNLRKVLVEKILQVSGSGSMTSPRPATINPKHEPGMCPLPTSGRRSLPYSAVLIGASTGGLPAIQHILEEFETPIPAPVVVVQHLPAGFAEAFTYRLNTLLPFPVREPVHGETLEPGSVYLAPAGSHLLIDSDANRLVAVCRKHPERVAYRPSIDILFSSAASISGRHQRFVAALLTGIGRDGAEGLGDLARCGAHTITQNEATCVVHGMPKAAKDSGAACEDLPLSAIAPRVNQLLRHHQGESQPSEKTARTSSRF